MSHHTVHKELLSDAIDYAQQACIADSDSSNIEQKQEAQEFYEEASTRLKLLEPFLPQEYAHLINKYSIVYQQRAEQMDEKEEQAEKNTDTTATTTTTTTTTTTPVDNTSSGKFTPPTFKVPFVEEKIPPPEDMNPPTGPHRTFWLMKKLEISMLKGSHIMNGLYVPKEVWFQTGAKLFAQQAKITFCTAISDHLRELRKTDENNQKQVLQGLDAFLSKADKEREALQKLLPSNTKTEQAQNNASNKGTFGGKLFKNIYKSAIGLVSGTKKEETTEHPYIPWLLGVFDTVSFLDKWVSLFENEKNTTIAKEIMDRLDKISVFFYSTVCTFVLQDLNVLLERYMRKSRESFSRLTPKKYKL